jgi:hypothetical protein
MSFYNAFRAVSASVINCTEFVSKRYMQQHVAQARVRNTGPVTILSPLRARALKLAQLQFFGPRIAALCKQGHDLTKVFRSSGYRYCTTI